MTVNDTEERSWQGWREVVGTFLKLGAMSYGGPAIMGIMQTEVQEKRQWLSRERFVEGLAVVNILPGPGATQLGIFLGYTRAGWFGGLLAGLCFILPALVIMLTLTMLYNQLGGLPRARSVFYGLNPVVVGIFAVAVWRLGRAAVKDRIQVVLAIAGALSVALTPIGIIPALLLAGAVGVSIYGTRRWGLITVFVWASLYGFFIWSPTWLDPLTVAWPTVARGATSSPGLWELGFFFFQVGAFTFGGGLSMLAFMQEQVVNQLQWLTPQQFLDGLALGQLTPGPILMLAAFVGYQIASLPGALVSAGAVFLPSFILMLSLLPVLERLKRLQWMKAALQGISPVVIGMIAVTIIKMLPNAVPDFLTGTLALLTVVALILWRLSPLPLLLGGGTLGILARAVDR